MRVYPCLYPLTHSLPCRILAFVIHLERRADQSSLICVTFVHRNPIRDDNLSLVIRLDERPTCPDNRLLCKRLYRAVHIRLFGTDRQLAQTSHKSIGVFVPVVVSDNLLVSILVRLVAHIRLELCSKVCQVVVVV